MLGEVVQLLGLVPDSSFSPLPLAERGLLYGRGVPPLLKDIAAVAQGARDGVGGEGEPRAALSLPVCPCRGGGGQDPAPEVLLCLEPRGLGRWELPGMGTLGKGLLSKWDPGLASPASPGRA